jgi:hypothetical protein
MPTGALQAPENDPLYLLGFAGRERPRHQPAEVFHPPRPIFAHQDI